MCEEGGRGGGEGVNIVTITEKEVGQLNSYPPAILEGITKQHSCMTNDATSAYLPLCVYHQRWHVWRRYNSDSLILLYFPPSILLSLYPTLPLYLYLPTLLHLSLETI